MNLSEKKKIIYVGMSGGVDSSVTAALLKSAATPKDFEKIFCRPTPKGFRGFDVRGVHIKMWSDESIPCQFKEDRRDALRVAMKLDIPFETWDFTDEYRAQVVNYMISEYAAGRTPNPDVMCNRKIKFGIFLERARARGADFIATGHYVRLEPEFSIYNFQFTNKKPETLENLSIENSLKIENYKLKIANDLNKDQSYFLWTLTQNQLKDCIFPLGAYTKPQVRALAQDLGLPTAEKPDSQGICFIGEIDMRDFLKRHIPEKRGSIVTTAGNKIGEHEGLSFYTIGQREGLGVGGGIPFYVAKKDFNTNTLVVASGPFDDQLFGSSLEASDVHWISGKEPVFPLACTARIRYRQPLQHAAVTKNGNNNISVQFKEPQRAITPGQSIVCYKDSEMLGGACIS